MVRFASYGRTKWAALMLPFCWMSCISDHDTVASGVNPEGWRVPIELRYNNTDTVSVKEAALALRYGPDMAPEKGTYIIEAAAPSGARTRDTLDIHIPHGNKGNDLHETRIPYRTNVRLAEEGEYVFTVIPPSGMRDMWSVAIDFKKLKLNDGER